jgi:RHS repeat-associated protein
VTGTHGDSYVMFGKPRPAVQRLHQILTLLVAVVVLVALGGQSALAAPVAADVKTPQQLSGTASDSSHRSGPAITKSKVKSGAPAVTPKNAAAKATTAEAPVSPRLSNTAQAGTPVPAAPRGHAKPAVNTAQDLVDKRTATTSVFANSDGSQTAHVYSTPVHYRTSTGGWANIDTTLTQGQDRRWAEKADSSSATFAPTAADPSLVALNIGAGQSIAFGLQGAANTTGVVSGPSITYPAVLPNAGVTYLSTASGGVKETLDLNSVAAPETWVFPLTLQGLTPSVNTDGSVVFTTSTGQVVDRIAHGFMRDSKLDPHSDEGAFSNAVTYSLTTAGAQPALRVTLDSGWLHDPARVFPVHVDPSVSNVNTSGSTYVMSPYTNDYSSESELDVGTFNGGGNVANSYLAFNVASLSNDYIEAATLNLDEVWSYSCNARPVSVSPILGGWSVGGTKTYPAVSYGGAIGTSNFAAGFSSGCPGPAWESIDLGDNPSAAGTQLIESWVHGGANNGLAVTASPSDSYGWKKFASINSKNPPYLSITYSPSGAAYNPANSYVAPTATASGSQSVTVTNLGNGAWTPAGQSLWYQLYDLSWNNLRITAPTDPPTPLPSTVNQNQSLTMTAKIGPEKPGQYYLCWDMFSGNTSFNISYGVPSPCELINSVDVPPQIDSASPASNVVLSSLQPQLFATGHDPDNYPNKGITYDFQVYTLPATGTPTLAADSGAQASGNYVVPAGKLGWNQRYYWTVRDYDTLGYSAWSAPAYFSTTVAQPLVTSHLGAANSSGRNFDPGVGDYTTSATDATVAVAGPALAVTRSYNSLDPRTTNLFGAGWSTAYDMAAAPDNDGSGNVVVTYPDGHTGRFGVNPDGTTFTPPQGTYATFATVPAGGYTLTERGGTTYTFAQQSGTAWRLTKITDADGRVETLTYNGTGNLSTVTNTTSGRSLHLTVSSGHVTQVSTDPVTAGAAPLTWVYSYIGNTLAGVCPPTSTTACTAYSYTTGPGSGSHYRSLALDAQPYAYWRLSDTAGTTVTDEVSANLGTKNGTATNVTFGGAGPLPGSPSTSGAFNGTSSSVTLPPHLVSSATYLSVQLWFQTVANGAAGVLFSTGTSAIGTANPSTGAMPVLYVGTDGKLYGQFWTGAVAPIVSAGKVNDATWHQATLVGQGTTQSLYLDGALVGSHAGQLANLDPGNFLGAGYVNTNAWTNGPAAGWSYFTGKIAETAFYTHALGAPAIAQQYAAGTHAATELTTATTPGGVKGVQAGYDNVRDRATTITDIHGGHWTLGNPTTRGSSAQYRGAVLASDPTDFWPLTDTTGTKATNIFPVSATIDSTDGYGTYANTTLGVAGPLTATGETAASFNGTSSTLALPVQQAASSDVTSVALWFKTTTAGGVLAEDAGIPLLYVGTTGLLYGYDDSGYTHTATVVTDGKWHLAVLAQGEDSTGDTQESLYLDGTLASSATGPTDSFWDRSMSIGSGAISSSAPAAPTANPHGYFTGAIADVAFYNLAITAPTVASLWQAGQSAATAGTPTTTTTVTDPGNSTLTYGYDPGNGGRLIASTDGLGGTTTYGYDINGFLYNTVYPDENYLTTTRDTRGNILSRTTGFTSSAATATSYKTYPAAGTYSATDPRDDEPLTYLNADSSGPADATYQTTYAYTNTGDPASTTDPLNRTTSRIYTMGTEPAPGGGTQPPGLPASSKDPLGHITVFTYNSAGDLVKSAEPSGLSTTYTYDNLGRRLSDIQTSDTFPTGVTISNTWDGNGRLLTETGPATTDAVTGTIHTPHTVNIYDPDGDRLTQTVSDTTGGDATRTTTNTYNSDDELATTTDPATAADPAGRTTGYGYDAYGNLASLTDPNGSVFTGHYDPNGNQLSTTLTGWTGDPDNPTPATNLVLDSRTYDPNGLLASDTDSMGRETDYQYFWNGSLFSTTMPNFPQPDGAPGVVLGYCDRDPMGNLLTVSTAAGQDAYGYDPAGQLSSHTDGNQRTTTYGYDADGHLASTVAPVGSISPQGKTTFPDNAPSEETDYTYDTGGNLASQTVHNGTANLVTTATHDQRGALTSLVDPRGNATGATPADYTSTYTHDAAGRLVTTTGAPVKAETGGGAPSTVHPITEYGYDTFGEKTSVSNPDGNITSNTYDSDGQLLGVSRPAYTPPGTTTPVTPTTAYSYTKLGSVATVTDPLDNVTTSTYDQLGNEVKSVRPSVDGASPTWLYTYDTDGEQLSATDPTGSQTQATWDKLGEQLTATQIVRQPTVAADTTTYTYDLDLNVADRPTTVTLPGKEQSSYTYGPTGEVLTATDPLSYTTSYTYDTDTRPTKTTLPDSSATTSTYDLAGRQIASAQLDTTGATLRTTGSGYDPAGNETSATDANNVTTTRTYDAADHATAQVQPVTATASITTSTGYDAAGHPTRYTDGDGNNTAYTYNTLGLLEATIAPGVTGYTTSADTTTTRDYDGDGHLSGVTEPGGVSQSFTYDALGRLLTRTGAGAEAATATRTVGYDLAGRTKSVSTPTTDDAFTYDDRGNVLTASGPSGTSSDVYNSNGQLASRTDKAGTATFTYTPDGQLHTAADPLTGNTATYSYNSLGQLAGTGYGTKAATQVETYDAKHELKTQTLNTPARASEAAVAYDYDNDGHVKTKTTTGTTGASANTYGYDLAGRLKSASTGTASTTYGYDDAGNRTQAGATIYTYNARDQLATATSGTTTSTHGYTARGTLKSAGSANYTYDAFDQLTSSGTGSYSYDGLGRTTSANGKSFTYDGTSATPVADGSQTFSRDPDGQVLSAGAGGSAAWALNDQHGDLTGLFTATGATLAGSIAFDSFGTVQSTSGAQADVGYQGGWIDPATGFVGTASRWYDPGAAAFTSHDTTTNLVSSAAAANPYTYGNDDPLDNADPTGASSCRPGGERKARGGSRGRSTRESEARDEDSDAYEQSRAEGEEAKERALDREEDGWEENNEPDLGSEGIDDSSPEWEQRSPAEDIWDELFGGDELVDFGEDCGTPSKPQTPSEAAHVAERVNEPTVNARPSGQVSEGEGETAQPGTRDASVDGPGADTPPNLNTVGETNPATEATPYEPTSEPGAAFDSGGSGQAGTGPAALSDDGVADGEPADIDRSGVDPGPKSPKQDVQNLVDNLDDSVYFHYTSEEGYEGILNDDGSLRIGANPAGKVHVTQEMGDPVEIEQNIYIGNPRFAGKADYLFGFRMPDGVELEPGAQPNEVISKGSLRVPSENVIYYGENPFGVA